MEVSLPTSHRDPPGWSSYLPVLYTAEPAFTHLLAHHSSLPCGSPVLAHLSFILPSRPTQAEQRPQEGIVLPTSASSPGTDETFRGRQWVPSEVRQVWVVEGSGERSGLLEGQSPGIC